METKQNKPEDMTIKEARLFLKNAKAVAAAIGQEFEVERATSAISDFAKGQYVIIRSRVEGINAGTLVEADETGVVLSGARRLWHHKPSVKEESWYEGVANHGLSQDSRTSATVASKVIIEDYSITLCTETAQQSIQAAVPHAQT